MQQLYEAHRLNQQNQIVIAQILVDRQRRRRPRPKTYWVKPWLSRRLDYGHYDRLMRELEAEDVGSFRNFVRMDPAMFREVLQRVGPRIEKYDTWYRKSINPGCRLAITLRFLATGEKYRSLMFGFRVAHNTISVNVRQTCEAILAEYGDEVLQCPRDAWKQVADEIFFQMELPPHPGGHRWQACGNQVSQEWWLPLLQLQGLSFSHTSRSCGCQVQVPVGGCWHQWIQF